jgi:uncharacterized membrane protein
VGPADYLATVAALAVLWFALKGLPWRKLADRESAAVWFGVLLALVAMRLAVVSLPPAGELHLLGAAIATLMFGWRWGVVALAVATAVAAAFARSAWIGLPWEFLCSAALPATATWWLLAASRRWLPRNPFAYFLGAAFAGGAVSALVAQLAKAAVLLVLGLSDGETIATHYLLTAPAMMFSEGFLTGGLLAVLATYRPAWVATFDDDFYLRG